MDVSIFGQNMEHTTRHRGDGNLWLILCYEYDTVVYKPGGYDDNDCVTYIMKRRESLKVSSKIEALFSITQGTNNVWNKSNRPIRTKSWNQSNEE